MIIACDNCKKPFDVTPSRLKSTNICCSRECAAEFKKAQVVPNTQCAYCKKRYYLKPSHLSKIDSPCCSRECSAMIRKSLFKGENNHQYGLKGELNSSFISDIKVSSYGYILVRNNIHPLTMSDGYMFFHRLIMEEFLRSTGQYKYLTIVDGIDVLTNEYIVHHKDENKLNNTLDNLEIMSLSEHTQLHSKEAYLLRQIDALGRLTSSGKIKSGKLSKHNKLDAGLDIYSSSYYEIPARSSKLISTDLRIAIPEGCVGLVWSRSGLSVKHNIEVGAGCIDSGYTGELMVHLYNHNDIPYVVNIGDKIAQLLTIPINLNNYDKVETLEVSERGEGGFGSTGV